MIRISLLQLVVGDTTPMILSLQSHFIVTGGDKTMIRIYGAGGVGGTPLYF